MYTEVESVEGKNKIRSVQMAILTFITQTGVGVITLPSVVSQGGGHDGWISIVVTGFLVVICSILIISLMKRYSDKIIYDINRLLYGKVIGSVFNGLLVLYLLFASVAGTSIFGYFIRITLLQETPKWILSPFIILPTFYLVWKGLKSMTRFLFISVCSYLAVVLILILVYREYRFTFLLPVGEAGFKGIYDGMKSSFFALLGFELVAFFFPYIDDRSKVLKLQLMAISISILFFVFVITACTAVFGEKLISILMLPFFSISRIYNAPVLERVDLYLTALWYIPTACSIRSYIFATYDGLNRVFKVRKTKPSYVVFFVLMLVLSLLPKNINQVFSMLDLLNYCGMTVTVFFLFCFLLSFIRKKGVSVN